MIVKLLRPLLQAITDLFVFHPVRGQHTQPSQLGMEFSDLRIVAEDGVHTQAWWMPSSVSSADFSGATVLTFHGNGGTMSDRLDWCQQMVSRGASVLAVEYRGYGESEGRPSEESCRADARAALAEAHRLSAGRPGPLLIHGRSLGGAVATSARFRGTARRAHRRVHLHQCRGYGCSHRHTHGASTCGLSIRLCRLHP